MQWSSGIKFLFSCRPLAQNKIFSSSWVGLSRSELSRLKILRVIKLLLLIFLTDFCTSFCRNILAMKKQEKLKKNILLPKFVKIAQLMVSPQKFHFHGMILIGKWNSQAIYHLGCASVANGFRISFPNRDHSSETGNFCV